VQRYFAVGLEVQAENRLFGFICKEKFWEELSNQIKLYYNRRSVGQSVLVSSTPFGPATNFSSFRDALSEEKSDL
jgi:hypothetical protein